MIIIVVSVVQFYDKPTRNKAFIGYACKVSLAGFFVKKICFAPILKRGFEDDGNTNSAHKAWHVKLYILQQQLNRRHKVLVPWNKPKEAEFVYILKGTLAYTEGQSY